LARARVVQPDKKPDYRAFWKRRIYRLYPAYFVALCLSMAMVVAGHLAGSTAPLVAQYPEPRGAWIAGDFVAHVTMLHGFYPIFDWGGGNPVYWTLAREEYLYALYFPLLAFAGLWGMRNAVIGVAALGVGFVLALAPLAPDAGWQRIINTSAVALWVQ
jgi:peptidoglycan/LPS O-acetylase OafA/YrhL